MSSITTKTKTGVKFFFNNRQVGSVLVEYVFWHPNCEHQGCEVCVEEDDEYICDGGCHREWNSISTSRFAEFIAKPKEYKHWAGVTEIRFTTDTAFLTYDTLDNTGDILSTHMIPINMIESISVHKTEQEVKQYDDGEEITHLRPDVKKSLK
jgi:hypothetical protein